MSTETKPELESALDSLDPDTVEVLDTQKLLQVAIATEAAVAAQHQVEASVVAARHAGFSWGKVAIALGVSRQSAHERYSKLTD